MAVYLVTGGAGFIGSNLTRALVAQGHAVRVIDDLSSGNLDNLAEVYTKIEFIKDSICDLDRTRSALDGVDFCLHQAAVPSVPRSIADPISSNRVNVEGTLNVFLAARDAGVKRVVFASSSSVYGDTEVDPLREDLPVNPVSPYGVGKAACEHYARVFSSLYGMEIVALRYFNVFGPGQRPSSPYAAVIPIFITAMLHGERPPVHGNGRQSRDFSYVDNVVDANLSVCNQESSVCGVFNVACGSETSIVGLTALINEILGTRLEPRFEPGRDGDIRRSCADISRAREVFGYKPRVSIGEGLKRSVEWYRGLRM